MKRNQNYFFILCNYSLLIGNLSFHLPRPALSFISHHCLNIQNIILYVYVLCVSVWVSLCVSVCVLNDRKIMFYVFFCVCVWVCVYICVWEYIMREVLLQCKQTRKITIIKAKFKKQDGKTHIVMHKLRNRNTYIFDLINVIY